MIAELREAEEFFNIFAKQRGYSISLSVILRQLLIFSLLTALILIFSAVLYTIKLGEIAILILIIYVVSGGLWFIHKVIFVKSLISEYKSWLMAIKGVQYAERNTLKIKEYLMRYIISSFVVSLIGLLEIIEIIRGLLG
ncbi:MAG: hypothetical protein NDF54_01915 [archaeon GB-1867-035]|nr:hypothetical protein [Candidatus Culexmicrobium profundum]